jgi:hypothetical protein
MLVKPFESFWLMAMSEIFVLVGEHLFPLVIHFWLICPFISLMLQLKEGVRQWCTIFD